MIQFNISGQYLELPADFDLQFTKKNILFAFDNIECERSTSFDIPDTPKNNAIFKVAKNTDYKGDGMRRRYEAQMQAGVVVKNGYLYVDTYEKGSYKAVFVTGELFGLLAIKNAGKMADYLTPLDYILTSDEVVTDNSLNWCKYNYITGTEEGVKPSVRLKYLTDLCAAHFGVNVQGNTYLDTLRIVIGSVTKISTIPPVADKVTFTSRWVGNTVDPVNTASVSDSTYVKVANDVAQEFVYISSGGFGRWEIEKTWNVRVFETASLVGLTIRFPDNFPNDVFVYKGGMPVRGSMSAFNFVGGYGFDDEKQVFGTPLAGREVEIPSGKFAFVKVSDWINDNSDPTRLHRGMFFDDGQSHLDFQYTLEFLTYYPEIEDGYIRLADHLPDLTFIEFMKANAAIIGKMLNYTDAGGFTYDDLNFSTWQLVELRNIVKVGKVERTFADYAQRNVVDFNSEEYVLQYKQFDKKYIREKQRVVYDIDNDNIEEQKSLLTIPYTEGYKSIIPPFISDSINEDKDNQTDMIMQCQSGNAGKYVVLIKNSGLQRLCSQSTSIEVSCLMSLVEYENIKPKTRLLYHGSEWVWTEAQYSKGVAKLIMSKI